MTEGVRAGGLAGLGDHCREQGSRPQPLVTLSARAVACVETFVPALRGFHADGRAGARHTLVMLTALPAPVMPTDDDPGVRVDE